MINSNKWVVAGLFVLLFCSGKAQPTNWQGIDTSGAYATGFYDLVYSENLDLAICTCALEADSGSKFIAGYNGSDLPICNLNSSVFVTHC